MKPSPQWALLALCCAGQAVADQQTPDATNKDMERIVVQGQRAQQAKPDTAIVSIDAQQISRNLSADLSDVLRYEPGVSVTRDERFGIGSINIRGMDGNRVKILVDGVELADSYGPTTTYLQSGRNTVDMDALARMDIIKGGDVSAGSGALGGVVQFRTKDPADFLSANGNDSYLSLQAGYRSDAERYSETATLANRHGAVESLLVYTRRDGQETENHGGGSDIRGPGRGAVNPGDNQSDNVLGKAIWHISSDNQLGVVGEHFNGQSAIKLYSESSATALNRSDDDITRNRLGLFQTLGGDYALFDQLHWQLDYQKTRTENGTLIDSATSHRFVNRFYDQKGYQGRINLAKQLGSHSLRYGANYQHQDYENLNHNTVDGVTDTSRFSPKADGNIYGLYLEDNWQLSPHLALLPAVRYDNYHYSTQADSYVADWGDSKNHKLTGQLGFNWQVAGPVALFGRYGSGFRAPSINDLYYYYENNVSFGGNNYSYIIRPNPNLKSEQSTFSELGLRLSTSHGDAELTFFDNHYRDFIESQVPLGASAEYSLGEFTSQNLDKVRIKGVEFKGALDLGTFWGSAEGLRLKGAAAYADGKNTGDDEPLDSVSPLQLYTGLDYDAPAGNWGSSLNVTWTARKKPSDITTANQWLATPSFTVVDMTAYYRPLEQLQLSAGLFNLLDKKYWVWSQVRTLSTQSQNIERYSQPGRNVGVGIKYSF